MKISAPFRRSKNDPIRQSDFYLIPNVMSVGRILAIPVLVVLMYYGENWWSAICFILVAASDGIDGYIARKYNYESKLGALLDPLADKLIVLSVMILLLWQGRLNLDVTWKMSELIAPMLVIVTVGREISITGLRAIGATAGMFLPADRGGKMKTALQFVAIVLLLTGWSPLFEIGQVLLVLSVFLALWSGVRYILKFLRGLPA